MALPIEDYAVIGDLHTAALVGTNGSIDWLCLPTFSGDACFCNLLGDEENGFWRIAPVAPVIRTTRRYREGTLVLETEFETETGVVRLTDCMPIREQHPQVVRIIEGLSGRVDIQMELVIRFGYGQVLPWVTQCDNLLTATAGPDSVALWTLAETYGENMRTYSDFTITEGQHVPFTFAWYLSHELPPRPIDPWYSVEATSAWWSAWSAGCTYEGDHRQAVLRSLITLKALTFEPTNGIVAAATTSLPEAIGGNRNWDYRYCWLRDATLTLEALMQGGYHEEAMGWRDWLLRAASGDVSRLQIMYGTAGDRRLDEWEVDWLAGYEGSKPVRIGNAASGQYQLDVYGEVMSALFTTCEFDGVTSRAMWDLQRNLIEFLEEGWKLPDDGIWEVRGPRRHFTHSKVMAWVAVDRAVRTLEAWPSLEGPLARWRQLREDIFAEVCEKGYSMSKQSFTQYYGSEELDASLLMIPLVGFLPPDDPRVVSTVEAIERELMQDGFVLRYRTRDDGSVDGLTGREGAFLACSFWMADCLHMIGRADDAIELFHRLLSLRNDLGLLSEEYDPILKRLVGNFPQAFSHVSLVNTAFRLSGHDKTAVEGAEEGAHRGAVAALGAPMVSLGKATRTPWRMWGAGRLSADRSHPFGQRLHVRASADDGSGPSSDGPDAGGEREETGQKDKSGSTRGRARKR